MSEVDTPQEAQSDAQSLEWGSELAAFASYCIRTTGRGRSADPVNVRHNSKPDRKRLAKRSDVSIEALRGLESSSSAGTDRRVLERVLVSGLGWQSLEEWLLAFDAWSQPAAAPSTAELSGPASRAPEHRSARAG